MIVDPKWSFDYMPLGSYAVLSDETLLFLTKLPEELKERFRKNLEARKAECLEKMKDPKTFIW